MIRTPFVTRRAKLLGCVASAGLLLALAGCKKANRYVPPPPPQVSVAVPAQQDVTLYLETTGSIEPVNAVDLVARVSGFLTSQNYVDGAVVAKNVSLFTIEQPPYAAKLQLAKAQQAEAQAGLTEAEQEYERQAALWAVKVNSEQNYDNAKARRDAALAELDQAKANTETASINYSYTNVTAPFDGLVSAHLVSVGQVVSPNGVPTTLATVVQLQPIYVNFSVSEPDVQRIRASLRARGLTLAEIGAVPVEVGLQTESGYPHAGTLDYTAPTVDPSSGTLSARGKLPNNDHTLLPGMFVRVRVPLGVQKSALLVPATAIGTDQGGSFVLVLGAGNVVEQREVTEGPAEGSSQVIDSGLQPEDHVIVDGLQLAIPGEKVVPQTVTTAAAAHQTAAP